MSTAVGSVVEQRAAEFLRTQGYTIVAQNFLIKGGELDLVAIKNACVFVEVRHRAHKVYGSAQESITVHKQRKLIRAAQIFLKFYPKYTRYPLRFDAICTHGDPNTAPLEWIQNAFGL